MTSAKQNIENQPELAPVNEDRSAWIIAARSAPTPRLAEAVDETCDAALRS